MSVDLWNTGCVPPRQENLLLWMRFWIAKTLDILGHKFYEVVLSSKSGMWNLETNLDWLQMDGVKGVFFCWSDSVFIFANPKLYDFCSEPGMLFPCPGPISAVSPKAAGSCGWVPVLEEAAEFEIHQITWWSHFKDIKTNIFDLWAGRSWTILTYIDNMQPKDFEGRSTEMSFQCCAVPF